MLLRRFPLVKRQVIGQASMLAEQMDRPARGINPSIQACRHDTCLMPESQGVHVRHSKVKGEHTDIDLSSTRRYLSITEASRQGERKVYRLLYADTLLYIDYVSKTWYRWPGT